MTDFADIYSEQNKILDIYLKNIGVGTAVIEINHQAITMQICEYLHSNYHLKTVDYDSLTEGIICYLRNIGNQCAAAERRVCIYNFTTDSDTIDVIRSLNISRELLRTVDCLVLVMPTIFVEQIRAQEPNLRDYIGLFLDYNTKSDMPFEPVFDVPFQKRFTRGEQKNLKESIVRLNGKENLTQYFHYINQFYTRRLSNYECHKVLLPALNRMEIYVHDFQWECSEDYYQAINDLLYQTAAVLAVQQYYELAKRQFEMIIDMEHARGEHENIRIVQGHEGMAYSAYWLRDYEKTEQSLLSAIQILENLITDNDAWICRLESNYAACLIQCGDYQKAQSILKDCLNRLSDSQKLNPEREMRIRINWMISLMGRGALAEIRMSLWSEFLDRTKAESGTNSINYAYCILMDAWYKGVLLGACKEALEEAREALEINSRLQRENSFELSMNYAVLEKLYNQIGAVEKEKDAGMRKKKILKICRNPYTGR